MKVNVATGNRRLRRVADLLDRLPARRFDMAFWVGLDWDGDPKLSCGTSACALGWATTIPSLRRAGLRLSDRVYQPVFRGAYGYMAAASLFGIAPSDARDLFRFRTGALGRGKAPGEVAVRIRRFVRHRVVEQSATARRAVRKRR